MRSKLNKKQVFERIKHDPAAQEVFNKYLMDVENYISKLRNKHETTRTYSYFYAECDTISVITDVHKRGLNRLILMRTFRLELQIMEGVT